MLKKLDCRRPRIGMQAHRVEPVPDRFGIGRRTVRQAADGTRWLSRLDDAGASSQGGTLYLKLRDNPQIVNPIALSVQALPPAPAETERTEARQSPLAAVSDPRGLAARALQRALATTRISAEIPTIDLSECPSARASLACASGQDPASPRRSRPPRPSGAASTLRFRNAAQGRAGEDQLLDLRGNRFTPRMISMSSLRP